MPINYAYDTTGQRVRHMTAADVANGGMALHFDAWGNPLDWLDPNGNYQIKGSCIEEAVKELGEDLS